MKLKVRLNLILLIPFFLFGIYSVICEDNRITDTAVIHTDIQYDRTLYKEKTTKKRTSSILSNESVDFTNPSEILQFCGEFVNEVNDNLKYYDTSVENEWLRKIVKYEKQIKDFILNGKNNNEYEELIKKLENANDIVENYNSLIYSANPAMVVTNPGITANNALTDAALLTIYGTAVSYFSGNNYLLAEELLEHMKTNNSINSAYKPINTANITSTQGYKDIVALASTNGSYNFEKGDIIAENDAYYALHSINYNKTTTNSGIVISDRYDYAFDAAYDDFKTDAVCNAMYILQERGILTPYYVIIECSEGYSSVIYEDYVHMGSTSRYIEKTGIIGKGDKIEYDFSVSQTSFKTIQTYGPDDTYISIYDSNNNLLAYHDDSGYNMNALLNYSFVAGERHKVVVRMHSSSGIGNIRVGFASVNTDSFNNIKAIKKSKGLFMDKYKSISITAKQCYGNIFLFQNNQGKDFTIKTQKNGNSYLDTYLYMIDPRRSNYYDGTGADDDYHPMCIFNDDGGGNHQAKLDVKYSQFFAQNQDFIIFSSVYNLTNSGAYTLSIDGLNTSHGVIL